MNDSTRRRLVILAGGLLCVSIAIHAVVGVRALVDAAGGGGGAAYGTLLLVGAAIPLLLIVAYRRGTLAPIEAYTFGCGLLLLSLYAYVDVHAIGVLESLTGVDLHAQSHTGQEHGHDHPAHGDDGHSHSHGDDGHSHGDNGHSHGDDGHAHGHGDEHGHDHAHEGSVLAVTADHLRESPAAIASKAAELCAAVVLAGLALTEGRRN